MKDQGITATARPVVIIEASVIRCGCGDPDSHNGVRGAKAVCPKPRAIEEMGEIARAKVTPFWRKFFKGGRTNV